MPTIIDSLVVELGFDVQGMDVGRKKVEGAFKATSEGARKVGKDIEKASKDAGEYMTRLRNNVLSLYAAFTAGRGLKEFVGDVTASNAALGRFSKIVGESAQTIASWRGAGKLMGIDAKEIDSTFANLTSQFQQFALTGDSSIVPWFRSLGITMADAAGHMKPMNDLLLELSQRVQGLDPVKANAILTNMGISPGMINLLLAGPPAIRKFLAAQQDLARAQAADAPAAAARQEAWARFLSMAEAVGTMLLTTLTPAIIGLTRAGEAFAAWGEHHPTLVGAAFSALTGLVLVLSGAILINLAGTALTAAAAGFTALTGLTAGLILRLGVLASTALPAVGDAFLAVAAAIELTPIGWVITGIAALSAIAFVLYKNWDKIAGWWKRLWGGMGEDAQHGADQIVDSSEKIANPGGPAKSEGPAQSGGKGTAPAYGSKGGPSQAEDIAFLTGKGWTREQATGVVANIQAESAGQLNRVGDKGSAYGLAQWHADRQARFTAWAGHNIQSATRSEQLGFIDYELRNHERGAGAILAEAKDAGTAARTVSNLYERPKNASDANTRAAIAQALTRAPAQSVPVSQIARAAAEGNRYQTNQSTNDVRIGEMHINTPATDAKGIAKDARGAVLDTFAQQSNYGPS